MTKLNLKYELQHKDKFYYTDGVEWYALNPNVKLPYSPIVNYKLYNDDSYFSRVNEKEHKALNSELEKLLGCADDD